MWVGVRVVVYFWRGALIVRLSFESVFWKWGCLWGVYIFKGVSWALKNEKERSAKDKKPNWKVALILKNVPATTKKWHRYLQKSSRQNLKNWSSWSFKKHYLDRSKTSNLDFKNHSTIKNPHRHLENYLNQNTRILTFKHSTPLIYAKDKGLNLFSNLPNTYSNPH